MKGQLDIADYLLPEVGDVNNPDSGFYVGSERGGKKEASGLMGLG